MNSSEASVPEGLSEKQREVHAALTAGPRAQGPRLFEVVGPDGELHGPFAAMLENPDVGMPLQNLGAVLRFGDTLDSRVRELIILEVAVRKKCDYEWYAHAAVARSVGVSAEAIAAIRAEQVPADIAAPEQAALQLARSILGGEPSLDSVREVALAQFGRAGVMTIVTLIGYYSLLADLVTVLDGTLPVGVAREF